MEKIQGPIEYTFLFLRQLIYVSDRYMSRFPGGSAGKESSCNAGHPGSIPGLGRTPGEGIGYPLQYSWVSLVAQTLKNPPAAVGDLGSIPGFGRSPAGGHGNLLQYSCPENSMDRGAWQAVVHRVGKSRT